MPPIVTNWTWFGTGISAINKALSAEIAKQAVSESAKAIAKKAAAKAIVKTVL